MAGFLSRGKLLEHLSSLNEMYEDCLAANTAVLDAATEKPNLVKIAEDWAVELKRQYDTAEMEINAHMRSRAQDPASSEAPSHASSRRRVHVKQWVENSAAAKWNEELALSNLLEVFFVKDNFGAKLHIEVPMSHDEGPAVEIWDRTIRLTGERYEVRKILISWQVWLECLPDFDYSKLCECRHSQNVPSSPCSVVRRVRLSFLMETARVKWTSEG